MRVKYVGAVEVKSGGCKPCGARKASRHIVAPRKEYVLPSGLRKTFYIGRIAEVEDGDGRFLISSFPEAFREVTP